MDALEKSLLERSTGICELCGNANSLSVMEVGPNAEASSDHHIYCCEDCTGQINGDTELDPNHWRCLNDSVWSAVPAVQVVSFRMLHKLTAQDWANNLLDMMYMDDDTRKWAESESGENKVVHKDSNGNVLQAGDSVSLIKDLKVKGTSMVAKRGTTVRKITLDRDNAQYIEGKVDGQRIVIITDYVKKC